MKKRARQHSARTDRPALPPARRDLSTQGADGYVYKPIPRGSAQDGGSGPGPAGMITGSRERSEKSRGAKMKAFKLEHISRDLGSLPFAFKELDSRKCEVIMSRLAAAFGCPEGISGSDLLACLATKSQSSVEDNAENENFKFSELLRRLNIVTTTIIVNWSKFDLMDEFDPSDFSRYFNYIWYPASDDIEVFDESFRWLIFVSHYGSIRFVTN